MTQAHRSADIHLAASGGLGNSMGRLPASLSDCMGLYRAECTGARAVHVMHQQIEVSDRFERSIGSTLRFKNNTTKSQAQLASISGGAQQIQNW
eukprot:SAG31_NODE_48_length_30945_cov_16.254263_38_plen_94_part_00